MADRGYYMVRALLSREQDFHLFFGKHVAAVGWSEVDFTQYQDAEILREAVDQCYYTGSGCQPQLISRKLNEVVRFWNLKKGDYIIVPYWSNIAIAEAEGQALYAPEDGDLANQHKVAYRYLDGELLKIPRADLSEGLQRRLRVPGQTMANLHEFQEEIDTLFQQKAYSYSLEMQQREAAERTALKEGLLANIQTGRTHLQTGGIGLEELVRELMICEGYDAAILPKNKFSGDGDADILAVKEDAFQSTRLLVQVKHHSGQSGRWGVQQLIDVLREDCYQDCTGWFVTSAAVSEDTRAFAADHNIEVMDGDSLADLLITHLPRLSETTRRALGLSPYLHLL